MRSLKHKSPSKLNLTLDIKGLRKDGYHEIDSLVTFTSLSDEIEIIFGDTGVEFIPPLPSANLNKDPNTAYLASEYFQGRLSETIKIIVHKNIPLQSGLGGGSSNGAVILQALNNLSKNPYTQEELLNIALKIGSDVPLFLKKGSYFRMRGRGEIVEEFILKQNLYLIVILTGINISTSVAYRAWDELNIDSTTYTEQFLSSGNIEHLGSAFWFVLDRISSPLRTIKEVLLSMNAPVVGVSGSGGTLFLPFHCPEERENFNKKITDSYLFRQMLVFKEDLLI